MFILFLQYRKVFWLGFIVLVSIAFFFVFMWYFITSLSASVFQVSDEYLATMVSVFFQIHLVQDESLFPLLAPLLPSASPTDILALHTLKNREV